MWTARLLAVLAAAVGAEAAAECAALDDASLAPCAGPRSARDFAEQVLDATGYDGTQRPLCAGGGPVVVHVQLRLLQMNGIDQKSGFVKASGYFRTWWADPRLAYDGSCSDELFLTGADAMRLWMPDIFVRNIFALGSAKTLASFVRVRPDGSIFRSEQVTITVKNPLDLGRIPYDSHEVKIVVASWSQDITRMRIVPRGGVLGPGTSGVGLSASAMFSHIWEFPEGAEDNGFETPGIVEVIDNFDHLTLSFPFKRLTKYHRDQVILPSLCFLLVSYIQFWVDPRSAPARASLAAIPVLIICALANSIYDSLPASSQRLWLMDNLMTSTVLSVLAAMQFGVVQWCLSVETGRQVQHDGLKAVEAKARFLVQQAEAENISMLELLDRYHAVETVVGEVEGEGLEPRCAAEPGYKGKLFGSSPEALDKGIRESDLLFIRFAREVFERFDSNRSGNLNANEVQWSLCYFNVYVSSTQAPPMICMFLRDHGMLTPLVESQAELSFSQFCCLLLDIDNYSFRHISWAPKAFFESVPPSMRMDVISRVLFPIIVLAAQLIFQLIVPKY